MRRFCTFVVMLFLIIVFHSSFCFANDMLPVTSFDQAGNDFFAQDALSKRVAAEVGRDKAKTPEEKAFYEQQIKDMNNRLSFVGDPNLSITGIGPEATPQYHTPAFTMIMHMFLSVADGCWFCPVFSSIFNFCDAFAAEIYTKLRGYFLSLFIIGSFVWLLFHVGKLFFSFHGPNLGEFMTKMFKTLGVILLTGMFLVPDISFMSGYFVDIPLLFGFDLNAKVLKAGDFAPNDLSYYKQFTSAKGIDDKDVKTEDICKAIKQDLQTKYKGKVLSLDVHSEFICFVKKVSLRLIKGIAMGMTFIAESWGKGALKIFPSFSMIMVGILIMVSYFALFIMIPFHLINLVLKLCFVIIMLPVFVICFPFSATRGYTKKGWNMLLSVLIEFITLSIFVPLAVGMIENGLSLAELR